MVSHVILACAVIGTAAAAWLSQGIRTIAGASGEPIALLPVSAAAMAIVLAAAAAVAAAWRAGASLVPLWLIGFVLLPWIPGLPAAAQVWSGPLSLLVWAAMALAIAASIDRTAWRRGLARIAQSFTTRPAARAGALAAIVYAIAASQVGPPSVPGGDEPHYLIITQSLLRDGDLAIENNHARGDYRSYYDRELAKPDYRQRGRNGVIYSIHAPGLPMLVAPAFAVAGYRGVEIFLIALASIASALGWALAFRVTGRHDAAWFGWAAVTFSATQIFHSFTVYPDGPGGLLALTGAWALLRVEADAERADERTGPWWLHGAALALLPWLHTRFAILAGSLGALVLLRLSRTPNAAGKAVAFLTVPAVSAICWLGFFVALYGTPDPSAPYAGEAGAAAFIPTGIAGLLFDNRFGLLAYAPVLAAAFAGLAVMLHRPAWRRLGLELLFVVIPYLLVVTYVAMWWGGRSAPARFLAPILPLLTIPAAAGWSAIRHRTTRAMAIAALAFTVFVSCALVFVDDGRMAFNDREVYSVVFEWLNSSVDIAAGLPMWSRGQDGRLFLHVAVWLLAIGSAWGLLRRFETAAPLRTRAALSAATAAALAFASMAALTAVWTLTATSRSSTAASQLELLRRIGRHPGGVVLALGTLRVVPVDAVPDLLRIVPPRSTTPGGAGPNDRPLYQVPLVPAGQYRLRLTGPAPAGWIMIGIGRDQFSLRSEAVATPPQSLVMNFPVDVRAIVVRGDEQARRTIRGLAIEPVTVVPRRQRVSDQQARAAVRYGATTVFFLDGRSFPDPEGFWAGGARTTSVVIRPDAARPAVSLLIRNAPADNHLLIEAGPWRDEAQLAPGEEHRVELPLAPGRDAIMVTITTAGGFRPSAADPRNRDDRFLGVWVKVLE